MAVVVVVVNKVIHGGRDKGVGGGFRNSTVPCYFGWVQENVIEVVVVLVPWSRYEYSGNCSRGVAMNKWCFQPRAESLDSFSEYIDT